MKKATKRNQTRELAEELDTLDTMLSALVELLEEKKILNYEEWENRVKQKLERATGLVKYRDIQSKKE